MGLLATLLGKVLGKPAPTAPTTPTAPTNRTPPTSTGGSNPPAAPTTIPAQVDVTAILDGLAAKSPEKLDWKTSIVDLMKLVGMDSSLSARKELAKELHYDGDTNDSAAMNIWLRKQVIQKIAENGGKVPQNLLS